jgi:ATP-dependent Clp protease adaptor protein ClpS
MVGHKCKTVAPVSLAGRVGRRAKHSEQPESGALSETEVIPPYKILLHNDDVTPMDFVVETLKRFFIPDHKLAVDVTMAAHREGLALVAVMALEHAEFKVQTAHNHARANGFPLTFTIERG